MALDRAFDYLQTGRGIFLHFSISTLYVINSLVFVHWGPTIRATDTEVDSLICTFKVRISESVRIMVSTDGESCKGGPGMDSSIQHSDSKVDSLIRTFKVQMSESAQIVNLARAVPVTVLERIPGPQCIPGNNTCLCSSRVRFFMHYINTYRDNRFVSRTRTKKQKNAERSK